MNKQEADVIISEYLGKLFGFALAKMQNISEAEELASQIALEVYSTLLKRDNISNVNGYIYKIAENVYSRFIAGVIRGAHLSLDEVSIPTTDDFTEAILESETYQKLRLEIAYLSKRQREIVVLHYYENKKLSEIADILNVPAGTVKWHLYEAKNNLKEGMKTLRETGTLGINPVKFNNMGHSGMAGSLGDTSDFLRKRITQNIAYAAYWKPKSINEIAEELNISPIFVEDEVDILEEYGFMDKVDKDKYLTNIYITEGTKQSTEREHELFNKAAKIICDNYVPLIVEHLKSIDRSSIYIPDNDFNLLLWSVVAVACGYKLSKNKDLQDSDYYIKRKDGGNYIAFASVETNFKANFDDKKYWACGNMDRGSMKDYPTRAWQLNTYYDGRTGAWRDCLSTDFDYLYELVTGKLKKEESQIEKFQRLYEKKYLRTEDDTVNIIVIKDYAKSLIIDEIPFIKNLPCLTKELKIAAEEIDSECYDIHKGMYPPHIKELCKLWSGNVMCTNQVRTRVLEQLLERGVLKLPKESQKAGLTTLMFCDKLPGDINLN